MQAPLQLNQVGAPLEWVAMDIFRPLPCTHQGNTYILVVMDGFTKWPDAYALPNQEAGVVAQAFVEGFVCRHRIAEELHTDEGQNFESQLLKEVCNLSSIRKTRTTPLRSHSYGMKERFNSTLIQQLALFTTPRHDDWDEHLPYLLMAEQTSQHGATACRPALLMYTRELRAPADLQCGPLPERHDKPLGEGYTHHVEEGMEQVHAFAHRQLNLLGVKMKHKYDHRRQASKYTLGMNIWFFNPRSRKGKCPLLT